MPILRLPNIPLFTKKRPISDAPTPAPKRRCVTITTPTTDNNTTTPSPLKQIPPSARWNPSIHPSSQAFTAVHTAFNTLLRDPSQTVDSILSSHFTPHERDLLKPLPPRTKGEKPDRRTRALAKIQAKNRWRYAELLRTERFGEWAGTADLAFKFAMVWFGLPVAPMGGGEVEEVVDVQGEGDGEREEGGQELRFLNGYTERVYEKDVGVREPDPKMEAYYVKSPFTTSGLTASVGLRGGEAPGEDSDVVSSGASTPIEPEEASASESGELTLRGGAPRRARFSNAAMQAHAQEASYDHAPAARPMVALRTPLGGFSAGTGERWLPLYGYQGVVWFRVDLHYSFVDAVDRLLCLDNRAGVSYSLYLLDKRKGYATQAERDHFLSDLEGNGITIWATGPGDYSNDRVAWEWLVDRLGVADDDEADQKVFFVAGPGDPIPWKWEPDASHQVRKIVLHWADAPQMNRPDIAYLRMPENPGDVLYTNQYGPWMANVCRVLAAGRIPGRPGYPAIPDAWFTVSGQGRGNSAGGTYGGLAFLPQLWDTVVANWKDDPAARVWLEARTGPESETTISNRWHLFLPGASRPYEKQYILHDEVDRVKSVREAIVDLVKSSMSDESFSKIESLEVHLPGAGFFLLSEGAPELVVSMTDKDLDAAFRPVVNRLVEWKEFLESKPGVGSVKSGLGLFPQFLSLRPVFDEYTICDADQAVEPFVWDPDATTLAQLRRLIGRVFSAAGDKQLYAPDKSWIAITQGGPAKRAKSGGSDPAEGKPKFLVGTETTDEEWESMARMIVEPKVFISLQDEKSLPRFGDLTAKQPFGYRDIYETPDELLYHAMDPDQIPHSTRHYDWQMGAQDVAPQLKTVQPWEDQPQSLSTFYAADNFPLRPPPGTRLPSAAAAHTIQELERPNPARRANPVARTVRQPGVDSLGFQPVTDVERGQRLRERSYAHPLDVRMHMSVPINAPPVDKLLNLGHNSVPVVSLSVLTPTEVRRLQRDYHAMRNLVLSRIERCPYAGCDAVYPANQPAAMQQHLREKHLAEKCNFCDEKLYAHWPPEWRYQHMVRKHMDVSKSFVSQEGDEAVRIPDKKQTDRTREGRWQFCSRCGRGHGVLDVRADRQHHDNVCYPGVQDRESDWVACGTCGDHTTDARTHQHRAAADGEKPFCEHCALPLGLFSEAYAAKHLSFCKGHGRDNAQHCPWCGIQLDDDFDARLAHIEGCGRKPSSDAEGPIDTARRSYFLPGAGRGTATSTRAGEGPAQRRRTEKAGEPASKAGKPPAKKMKISVPPPRTSKPREGPAGEEEPSPVSSAPSSSHMSRPAAPWLPPPPPPAVPAATPTPKPAAPAAKPAAAPAKGRKTQAKTPAKRKPSAKPKKATPAKPKQAATPKKTATTTPKKKATTNTPATASPPASRTRYQTRASAAAKRKADGEPEQGVAAKAARTVSFGEPPLARGALPVPVPARGVGARWEQRPGIRLAGVGTRWGIY